MSSAHIQNIKDGAARYRISDTEGWKGFLQDWYGYSDCDYSGTLPSVGLYSFVDRPDKTRSFVGADKKPVELAGRVDVGAKRKRTRFVSFVSEL